MSTNSHAVHINWSVWDKTPTVGWRVDGKMIEITTKLPPIAVSHLNDRCVIAIVGDFDEFGSKNLLLYSYSGELLCIFTAPELGKKSQFVWIVEENEELKVTVGFDNETTWQEVAGRLNSDQGTVTNLHRSY